MLSLAEYGMPWAVISRARAENIVEGEDILALDVVHLANPYFIRCIFRNKPALPNDSVILPASFPPVEPEPECTESSLGLSDKDMDHVECFRPSYVR
jgi:hypothetical protein